MLFFTDGAIEEHRPGGQQFGMERLIDFAERAGRVGAGVQEVVRGLSDALARARDGVTTGDTTLFLGLLKAISHFDPAICGSLGAYARPCISGELKRQPASCDVGPCRRPCAGCKYRWVR